MQKYSESNQKVTQLDTYTNPLFVIHIADSIDACKKNQDLGTQGGHNRRTKDLLAWAKKRRRHIRREDLIAYLCSRSPPPRHKGTPPISRTVSRVNPERSATLLSSPRETMAPREEPDLQPFKDALALHGMFVSSWTVPHQFLILDLYASLSKSFFHVLGFLKQFYPIMYSDQLGV